MSLCGRWWHWRVAGAFCCSLTDPPSWASSADGASMVPGGTSELLLHSAAVYTLLHQERVLPMGRL